TSLRMSSFVVQTGRLGTAPRLVLSRMAITRPSSLLDAVRAGRAVQATIRNDEVREDLTPDNRFGHDAWDILKLHAAVPHALWINYDRGPVLALFEAARVVCAHQGPESGLFQFALERVAQSLAAFGIAASSRMPGLAHIAAHEHMKGKRRHSFLPSQRKWVE